MGSNQDPITEKEKSDDEKTDNVNLGKKKIKKIIIENKTLKI